MVVTEPAQARIPALQIGRLSIWPPVIQAPMAALTGPAMRILAEEHGCGLTVTELLPVEWLVARNARSAERMERSSPSHPFAVQLHGANPERMGKAADMVAGAGAELVDLNMGCPNRQVVKGRRGAALMRDAQLAADLVRATHQGVSGRAEVTVKIRAGWDERSVNAPEFAQQMVDAGAGAVTVHGRTREQRYDGHADHRIVAHVKQAVDVPVIVNGDIEDEASLERALEVSGADGAMVGRAAIGNPWIFSRLKAWCEGVPAPDPPTEAQRIEMFLRHLRLHLAHSSARWRAVIEMRKFAPFYLQPLAQGERLRHQINRLDRVEEIEGLLQREIDRRSEGRESLGDDRGADER